MKIYFILSLYLYATNGKHLGNSKRELQVTSESPTNKHSIYTIDANSLNFDHNQTETTKVNHNSTTDLNQQTAHISWEKQTKESSLAWYTSNKIHDSNSPTVDVTNLSTSSEIIQGNNLAKSNLIEGNVIKNQSRKSIYEDRLHKPKIIVTFLSTSKLENNRTEPIYIDPFQRILQFFLSTFIRDLTEPKFPFDRDERGLSSCGHGHGFSCPRCMARKREPNNNTVLNLLPEDTGLKQAQELRSDATKRETLNKDLTVKRSSDNLSPHKFSDQNHLDNAFTTHESSNIKFTSQNLTNSHSFSNPKDDLVLNDSDQESSNYLRLGRSNKESSNQSILNVSNKTNMIEITKQDNRNINNGHKMIVIDGNITEVTESNLSHRLVRKDHIDKKPKVILHEYYINSRNPTNDLSFEKITSLKNSNNEKIVLIDATNNVLNQSHQISNVKTMINTVKSRDLHLDQKQINEIKLKEMEGIVTAKDFQKPSNDTNFRYGKDLNQPLSLNGTKIIDDSQKEHIVVMKNFQKPNDEINVHYDKDLNLQHFTEGSDQRLIRNINIPQQMNAIVQKETNEKTNKNDENNIHLLSRIKEDIKLNSLNPENQAQDSIILRTQRQNIISPIVHTVEDVNLQHRVEETKDIQGFKTESPMLLKPKDLLHEESTKNLQSLELKDLIQQNTKYINEDSKVQQGQEASNIVYADVNKGVGLFHDPKLRNQANNLTRMKYSIVNEKRATPLIEIVSVRSNDVMNESINLIDQELRPEDKKLYVTIESLLSEKGAESTQRSENVSRSEQLSTATNKYPTIPPPKHLNHYFLSISGDAEKSVAAAQDSDDIKQSPGLGLYSKSNANVDENESLDSKRWFSYIKKVRHAAGHTGTEDPQVEKEQEIEIDEPPPIEEDAKKPSTLNYSKMYYVFTVTIPVVAAFGLLIGGLCFCFRSSGLCCRLFLTDPTVETKI